MPRPVISTHPRCRCRRIPFLKSWAESGAFDINTLRGRVYEDDTKSKAANPARGNPEPSRKGPGSITPGNSVIPGEKLTGYILNKEHPRGRDKAIAFEKALGYNQENYKDLAKIIKNNLKSSPATYKGSGKYGDRYEIAMDITGPNGKTARVLTGWLLDKNGKARMVTAYVDKRK